MTPHEPTGRFGRSTAALLAILVFLLLLGFVPEAGASSRLISLAITAAINVVVLYGLSILFGQTGILSLGHAALVGVGAYTAAILARDFGVGFWGALPAAALLSALLAVVVGFPSLRVSGHHFVILTFALGQLFTIFLTNGGAYTGGATGLDLQMPTRFLGLPLDSLAAFYRVALAFVAMAALASWGVINSRYGRTLRAVRENEKLSASVGISVGRQKIGAFAVSGLFAGVSGVLMAYFLRHIAPSQFASFPSIYLALMLMIGGARVLFGPLAGGILVSFLPEIFDLDPVESRILYGVSLIAVILLLPQGVVGGVAELWQRLTAARHAEPAVIAPRTTSEA